MYSHYGRGMKRLEKVVDQIAQSNNRLGEYLGEREPSPVLLHKALEYFWEAKEAYHKMEGQSFSEATRCAEALINAQYEVLVHALGTSDLVWSALPKIMTVGDVERLLGDRREREDTYGR